MIRHQSVVSNLAGRNEDSIFIYFVPFVRDSASVVNASMIVTTTPTDTTIDYLCDWQYRDSISTGLNSRSQFLLLMNLDKNVFGQRLYKIKDTTAFGKDENNNTIAYVKLANTDSNAGNNLMVATTVSNCYWYWHPRDEGQLVGCPPGPTCMDWIEKYRCDYYTVWTFVEEDGGSSGGGTGTGGGGSTGGPTPPECDIVPVDPIYAGRNVDPCEPGWEPLPIDDDPPFVPYECNYQLTQHEQNIFNQLAAEDDNSDQDHQNLDCKGTKRTGNINFNGTKEHWLIQLDYVSKNLTGEAEFAIPGSSPNGNRGYADLVNLQNKSIFEIKPDNAIGWAQGIAEVANYVSNANIHCSSTVPTGIPWNQGGNYSPTILPTSNPYVYLKSRLHAPGVIVYSYESGANPNPAPPITVPSSMKEKFRHLIDRLKQNFQHADKIIAEYLHQHPELVTYIKSAAIGVGVAIVVGTIIEDVITAGAGIADDWACFVLSYRIIRFAVAL